MWLLHCSTIMARRVDLSIPDRNISNPLVLDPSDRQESSQRLEALEAAAAFHLPVFSQEVVSVRFLFPWLSHPTNAIVPRLSSALEALGYPVWRELSL